MNRLNVFSAMDLPTYGVESIERGNSRRREIPVLIDHTKLVILETIQVGVDAVKLQGDTTCISQVYDTSQSHNIIHIEVNHYAKVCDSPPYVWLRSSRKITKIVACFLTLSAAMVFLGCDGPSMTNAVSLRNSCKPSCILNHGQTFLKI